MAETVRRPAVTAAEWLRIAALAVDSAVMAASAGAMSEAATPPAVRILLVVHTLSVALALSAAHIPARASRRTLTIEGPLWDQSLREAAAATPV